MTGLLDGVAVVLELVPEPELDPEDELDDDEEPPLNDEESLPLRDSELLPDEPLPDDDDEEPLPVLFLLAPALDLALVVAPPSVELPPPEEPFELLLP